MATRKRFKLLRLLEPLIDGLLLLIFIPKALILGCLLLYGYIPIPADWLNEQLAKAEVSEFRYSIEYQLCPDGKLQLKDIAIFAADNEAAIFEAENAYLHYELFRKGRPIVDISGSS